MKHLKLTVTLFGAIFLLGLLALNMYSSTSLPGLGGGAGCYNCHNDPAFINNHDGELAGFNATDGLPVEDWETDEYLAYSRNVVPLVPVEPERAFDSLGEYFANLFFATNDSHFRMLVELPFDPYVNSTGSTADKFAIIFNIDVANFSIGESKDFSTMKFSNGEADMWVWDASDLAPNGTDLASDMYVDTSHYQTTGDAQDVTVDVMFGPDITGRGDAGYWIMFTRVRDTGSAHDVVFEDGNLIQYAIAYWNATSYASHLSSSDHSLVVGDGFKYETITVTADPVTTTDTTTDTTTKTTDAFTAVIVLGTFIAIPVIFRLRKK